MFIHKQLSCWFLKIAVMLCGENVLSKLYDRFSFFWFGTFPANICWSTRHVLKTSSACLQHNSFCLLLWRHLARRPEDLQDVFKTSWKIKNFMLKTSWRHNLKTSSKDVLKTSWRHVLKTSSRHLRDKQKCLLEMLDVI